MIADFSQIRRILNSGGQAPAPQSAEQLKKLVEKSQNMSLGILAGNGMTPESLSSLIPTTGVEEVHFGSAVRFNRSFMYPIDPAVITAIKSNLKNLSE